MVPAGLMNSRLMAPLGFLHYKRRVSTFEVTPAEAGLETCKITDLQGGDAEYNATALTDLLDGKPSAYRDTVIFTSAAALIVANKAPNLYEGAAIAASSIDEGKARAALDKMIKISHEVVSHPMEENPDV